MDVPGRKKSLSIKGVLYDLSRPLVMGIFNYTPDSFFDGGRHYDEKAIISRIGQMIEEEADIIDIGGVSTRPGAVDVSEEEEIRRLSLVMDLIRHHYPEIIVSVDTYRSAAARRMVEDYDVAIINDISCGSFDKKMLETVADLQVPYVAVHMQGTPQTMQKNPIYDDVVNDIIRFLLKKLKLCTESV